MKKLVALVLVASMMMLSTSPCWAEEAAPASTATPTQVEPAKPEVTGGDITAAAITDVVYVPGKVCFCVLGGVGWALTMVLSGATAYKTARDFAKAGCTGKWVLTGEDFAGPNKEDVL